MATKLGPDLDAMSVTELNTLIKDAIEKRDSKIAGEKTALIAEFRQRAAELGIAVEDIYPRGAESLGGRGRKQRKDAGNPVAAKYRGPNGEEWSGRGRRPAWLVEAIAGGQDISTFLL